MKNSEINQDMKIVFLHGLGQDEKSWNQVIAYLPQNRCSSVALFPEGQLPNNFEILRQQVLRELKEIKEPFMLVGLSLGAMLAVSLVTEDLPQLSGLVLSAGQYKIKGSAVYKIQKCLFTLLPKSFFAKKGIDKRQMIRFYQSLEHLDLTEDLRDYVKPSLMICGGKDTVNLKASRELVNLLPKGQLRILEGGNHTLNQDFPKEFANLLKDFLTEISSL